MRNKIYQIIEPADDNLFSKIYDVFIMMAIVVSMIPLAFKQTNVIFNIIEYVTVSIFVIDYALRLLTADLKLISIPPLRIPFTLREQSLPRTALSLLRAAEFLELPQLRLVLSARFRLLTIR